MINCSVILRPGKTDDPVFVRVTEYAFRCFLKDAHELTILRLRPLDSSCSTFFVRSVATGYDIAVFDLEEDEDVPEYTSSWVD